MPNIPLAITAVATFADTRVRFEKKVIGISGSRVRDSTTISARSAAIPTTRGQTTAADPQV